MKITQIRRKLPNNEDLKFEIERGFCSSAFTHSNNYQSTLAKAFEYSATLKIDDKIIVMEDQTPSSNRGKRLLDLIMTETIKQATPVDSARLHVVKPGLEHCESLDTHRASMGCQEMLQPISSHNQIAITTIKINTARLISPVQADIKIIKAPEQAQRPKLKQVLPLK